MTTIIYKNGKLYADSRVTYFRQEEDGTKVLDSVVNDVQKIIEPDNLYIGNRKVLALACAGDIAWTKYCTAMDQEAAKHGESLDILNKDFYSSMSLFAGFDTQMIAVTPSRVFLITFQFLNMTYQEVIPTSWIVIGSGVENIPNLGDTVLNVSAEIGMADAIMHDEGTGGPVSFWRYGRKGVRTLELNAEYSSFTRKMVRKLRTLRNIKDVCSIIKARIKVYPKAQYA